MKIVSVLGALSLLVGMLGGCEPQEPTYSLEENAGSAPIVDEPAATSASGTAGTPVPVDDRNLATGGSPGSGSPMVTSSIDAGDAPTMLEAAADTVAVITATATFHGAPDGTAIFTQMGTDVTVTVKLGNCAPGRHPIFICDGFSCDSPAVEGNRWDGDRGNLGADALASSIDCQADKRGTLTYTRSGMDLASRWTVSDHDVKYDVTNRVIVVTEIANESQRLSCADFR
jgi:hypothetical protein